MADIFFSYKSADRERVRPIHDALEAQGFKVFWDQEVPPGKDWDNWIRQHLREAKCAVVFWSTTSVASKNVRHEATVADGMGKLVSVLLEALTPDQFPMGMYTNQAVNLTDWKGDIEHEKWRQFCREVKAKLMPGWVQQQIGELEAELVAERTRREGVERRDRALQAQIAKEVRVQQELKRKRDAAADEAEGLKAKIDELDRAKSESNAQASELSQQLRETETRLQEAERQGRIWKEQIDKQIQAQEALKQERHEAVDEAAALKVKIRELDRARSERDAQAANLSQRLSEAETQLQAAQDQVTALNLKIEELRHAQPERQVASIVAALATAGFWTYQFMQPDFSTGGPLKAQVDELGARAADLSQRLSQAQTALNDANAKAEQLTRAKAQSDARGDDLLQQLKGAQAALNDAKAPIDALNRAKAAAPSTGPKLMQNTEAISKLIQNTEAISNSPGEYLGMSEAKSIDECVISCRNNSKCRVFTFQKIRQLCHLYSRADFRKSESFISGMP